MKDSVVAGGPGGQGDLRAPSAGRKKWGELPPRDRDKVVQSKTEGFPPGYEDVLESYYRSLAEERAAGDGAGVEGEKKDR